MNEKLRKFWGPYIAAIGSKNFYTNGMFIQSKHYCGMDISLAEGAEQFASSQLQAIMRRHDLYKEVIAKGTLKEEDLSFIFMSLVEKSFFDDELVYLIDNHKLDVTDEEYWEIIKSVWSRQELNTDGNRKKTWRKVFSFRPPVQSLTNDLPDQFTAYRAGKEDGFSWTLSKEVAEWFQQRFKAQFGKVPFLERTFKRSDVVFYTNDRNEQEVVILPQK